MKHEPNQPFTWKSSLGVPVSWVGQSGDPQGRSNSISQVDGSLRYGTSLPALWRKVRKRDNGLCLPFCLGESCPPALVLMPNTSVPPCMLLVPFKLLLQCWSSEGVSLSKSVCGFFKRNGFGLHKFLPLTQSSLGFTARSNGDLSSWHQNPELGHLGLDWDSSLLRYPS